jgi:cell division protein FtsQ
MKAGVALPLDIRLMNAVALLLSLVFILLLVVVALRWLVRQPAFDIEGISVVGQVDHNNAVTLRANVAPRIAGTFFSVNPAQVRAAFESVPWVRQAVVRRVFPNRLQVDLQEHQAVAYWGAEGELRLLNSFGEVFEANLGEVEQDPLPRLNGPQDQSAEVLAMYKTLAPMFAQMQLSLAQLELSARGSWSVRLENDASIQMGSGSSDEVVERCNRFLKTLTQVTSKFGRQSTAVESADLRHENGYALRLHGVATQVAALTGRNDIRQGR